MSEKCPACGWGDGEHTNRCSVWLCKEARKQAFLEAAEMLDKEYWASHDDDWDVTSFCDEMEWRFRRKAEEN